MWRYEQTTGRIVAADGTLLAVGYAGHGAGVNNPAMQDVPDVGPLPQGVYSLGAPIDHPKLGPFAIPLIPHAGDELFGRSGFYMHGDEIGHVGEHLASHGCIVADRDARESIWASGDHALKVTP